MNVNTAKKIVNQLFKITGDYCNVSNSVYKHSADSALISKIELYVANDDMKPSDNSSFYYCYNLDELEEHLISRYPGYKSVKVKNK